MLHQLPLDRKLAGPIVPALAARPARPHMVEIPAGSATLGQRHNSDSSFGWDNEFQAHRVEVPAFSIERTVFGPFPGFAPLPFYPGYSADFFDGAHYVAKGGSARTAACLLRRPFRNWFQPHYPYVYAAFRGVKD